MYAFRLQAFIDLLAVGQFPESVRQGLDEHEHFLLAKLGGHGEAFQPDVLNELGQKVRRRLHSSVVAGHNFAVNEQTALGDRERQGPLFLQQRCEAGVCGFADAGDLGAVDLIELQLGSD